MEIMAPLLFDRIEAACNEEKKKKKTMRLFPREHGIRIPVPQLERSV